MANLYNKAGLINIPVGYSDGFLYNIKPTDNTLGFRFDRASAATRVNKEGLIEQVGYFGPELVQNGDFSELGTELITNGGFDTDSDWDKPVGLSISNGVASANNVSSGQQLWQSFTSVGIYKVEFTISNYTIGGVKPIFHGGTFTGETIVKANGTYIQYIKVTSTPSRFSFQFNGLSTMDIDNVSVKEVGQNWTLATGWSMGDGVAISSGVLYQKLYQNIGLATNKNYKFTIEIKTLTSGSIKLLYYTGSYQTIASNLGIGTHTIEFNTSGSVNGFIYIESTNFIGSIDNISVIEVLGDKPRIDYTDSLTSPSFLLEPQSTNLLEFSEDFSQSYWNKTNSLIESNNTISPNGSLNASKLKENVSNGNHNIYSNNLPVTLGSEYTFSLYLKKAGRSIIKIDGGYRLTLGATFNLDTLDVTGEGTIERFKDDWYKITANGVGEVSNGVTNIFIFLLNDYGVQSYQGNGTSGVYIWGAQLEQKSYATSYIPTAGSTVTRAAETCNGAGNASTFNSTEGVLYAEIAALANDLTARVICISDGTNSHRVLISFSTLTNQIQGFHYNGITSSVSLLHTVSDITVFHKIAFKYKLNDFSLWVDGVQVATSSSGGVNIANTFNTLEFQNASGTSDFYGKGKGVYVFNKALTDDELQQLTGPEYNSFAALAAAYNYTVI